MADAAAKKKQAIEETRGGHFFAAIRMWRILHDHGSTPINKEQLARKFFAGIEDEEHPDRETIEDVLDEYDEDLGLDLLDDASEEVENPADGPEAWGVVLSDERTDAAKASTPYAWIKEKHKRKVQRIVEKLQRHGIGIDDVDENDNVLNEDELAARKKADRWAERWWRYNPNGAWAEDFRQLLNTYGANGRELVALMALRDLLEDMKGTPHQHALQDHLDRMMSCVPRELREEAIEQSRGYRHSVGNAAKYLPKREHLERWYDAVLHRKQVLIRHTTPGYPERTRHLAALSTVFDREENSLFLLGSEKTDAGWGIVKQWKFDRVASVEKTGVNNPPLAAIPAHALVRRAPGSDTIERLDNKVVYNYSSGAWLEFGSEPRRLELVVRVPDVSRPGMGDEDRRKLQDDARRRAYSWMSWCREKPFHRRQVATMETLPNGEQQLRLVVERCYITEMSSRLLRLQDCFEVVEPPELVVLLRQYAGAISAGHGKNPSRGPGASLPVSRGT